MIIYCAYHNYFQTYDKNTYDKTFSKNLTFWTYDNNYYDTVLEFWKSYDKHTYDKDLQKCTNFGSYDKSTYDKTFWKKPYHKSKIALLS